MTNGFDETFLESEHTVYACIQTAAESCVAIADETVCGVFVNQIRHRVIRLAYAVGVPTLCVVYGVSPVQVFQYFHVALNGNGVHYAITKTFIQIRGSQKTVVSIQCVDEVYPIRERNILVPFSFSACFFAAKGIELNRGQAHRRQVQTYCSCVYVVCFTQICGKRP